MSSTGTNNASLCYCMTTGKICEYANTMGYCLVSACVKRQYYTNGAEERYPSRVFYTYNVDAVEVVRCKDCKHSYDDLGGLFCSYGVCVDCKVYDDFYCAYGKR